MIIIFYFDDVVSVAFNLDSAVLKSFLSIVETRNITRAAEKMGRTQAALSIQVKKLEEALDSSLFHRTGHALKLTSQGQLFLEYAKKIVQLESEVFSLLQEPDAEGEITLGTPEDFATHYLPDVLATFRLNHPRIQLKVYCDLTLKLMERFRQGDFDIILVKRDPGRIQGGTQIWRERLIWAAGADYTYTDTLSLVLSPEPCIYRARALAALTQGKIPWRVSYTSQSFAGIMAAVKAGLGITILPSNMLPNKVYQVPSSVGLPKVTEAEIALLKRPSLTKAGEMLTEHIINQMERGLKA